MRRSWRRIASEDPEGLAGTLRFAYSSNIAKTRLKVTSAVDALLTTAGSYRAMLLPTVLLADAYELVSNHDFGSACALVGKFGAEVWWGALVGGRGGQPW